MATWLLLIQFIFRLTFAAALAMVLIPPQWVRSGSYRVHLWGLLGFNTLATIVLFSRREGWDESLTSWNANFTFALILASLSYVGSVLWLYEKKQVGNAVLFTIAVLGFLAAAFATPWRQATTGTGILLALLDLGSGGVLLGVTLSVLILGHWYLNTPSMKLLPLKRLVVYMVVAVVARTLVSGTGLVLQAGALQQLEPIIGVFIAFRWLTGLLATLLVALMSWHVLKAPNTQSATGILYAGVIFAFLGEVTSQLLSVDALYPL